MNGDTQMTASAQPTAATALTQTGDKNIQIAHADAVHNTIHISLNTSGVPHPARDNYVASDVVLNTDFYNLFVMGCEPLDKGHFTVSSDRALTEYISKENAALFSILNNETIAQIKTFPSIFTNENQWYGHAEIDQMAYFGIVTDIKLQDNGYKVYFKRLSAIPLQKLNENMHSLSISGATSFNELNRTHWTIKRINLIEELEDAGIRVLLPE